MSKTLRAQVYGVTQVAKMAECPAYLVDRYDRLGIVQPSVARAKGSGRHYPRQYSYDDVVCMAVAARLRRLGVRTKLITDVVRRMRKDAALRNRWLATDGRRVYLRETDGALVDLLRERQLAIAVLLEPLTRVR